MCIIRPRKKLNLNLAPYIKELVTINECIILPDFGGFETHYTPAKYDTTTQQMLPPDKVVTFKPEYKVGGEILIDHLQRVLNKERQEARNLVNLYVEELKRGLSQHQYFLIEEVGEFRIDSNGNSVFSPLKEENYLADSFGLEPLKIDEIEIDESPVEAKIRELKIRPRNNTLTFVVVGIIVVFVLLALTVFISSKFNLYLFNIGMQEETNDMIILGGSQGKDSTYTPLEETINEITTVKNALSYSEQKNTMPTTPSKFYILVAGSFKGFNNAQELQKKLIDDGFSVEIVEATGYYRVSIGKFFDKPAALSELNRIRNQINRSVWLLTVTKS